MFDIADKEELIQTIIREAGYSHINLNINNHMTVDHVKQEIERGIDESINATIRSIINHLYTNQEFESDIGLNKV